MPIVLKVSGKDTMHPCLSQPTRITNERRTHHQPHANDAIPEYQ